ncbi:MAG: FAD-dependent oxidoreductase [Kofleriaceae bacterium]
MRLAAELGDVIQLEAAVRAIRTGPPCSVTTDAATQRAHHVVLALPPALAREIDVPLAAPHQAAVAASRPGPVVKLFAAYDRAFWRDTGWSGEAYFPRGAVRATVALADAEGAHPMLLAFLVGPEAAAFHASEPETRRAGVLATRGEAFGDPATRPLETCVVDWSRETWSRGCVAGLGPGVLASGARWREPSGNVHIAGTESAIAWPGYMEGAIEAGERAAQEILAAQ